MSDLQLITELLESPSPRPERVSRRVAARLFPWWQAVLVGVPLALGLTLLCGPALMVLWALPAAKLLHVETPVPDWFGHVSACFLFVGVALSIGIAVRMMRKRRRAFVELARDGVVVETTWRDATGLAGALGSDVGKAVAGWAFGGGVAHSLAATYGAPIVIGSVNGENVEARAVAPFIGEPRVPELMLVGANKAGPVGLYVGMIGRAGWIAPQRVLRRTRRPV